MRLSKHTLRTLLCLLTGAMFATGIVWARAGVTLFTATETLVDFIAPGEITSPGGNIHVRGGERLFSWAGTDPRVNGLFHVVVNANFGKNGSGPIWGTAHAEIGPGVWDGAWQGSYNLALSTGEYEFTGHGSGGFGGLLLKAHCVYTGPLPGTCTGRILDSNGR